MRQQGILNRIRARLSGLFSFRGWKLTSQDPALIRLFGGGAEAASGATVTEISAMNHVSVMTCVKVLAESVASLPRIMYRRVPEGRARYVEHPLYRVLHKKPCPEITAFEFTEMLMGHLGTWGNGYANIQTAPRSGRILGLWPLPPNRLNWIERVKGELVYSFQIGDEEKLFSSQQILHIRGLMGDGVKGLSPIGMARESIGLSMAAEEYGSRFFANNARPSGVLMHPGPLSKESKLNLKASWEEAHKGLSNSHRVALLEEGLKWEKIGVPPEDAQFLETRLFQLREIARFYRIPPHMVGDLEAGASFASVEQQNLNFAIHTIRPWLVRWEQAIERCLLSDEELEEVFVEHLMDALLRGDTLSRYRAYYMGRQGGWLSVNDILKMENRNPIGPDGDIYLQPLNMTEAGQENPAQQSSDQQRALLMALGDS